MTAKDTVLDLLKRQQQLGMEDKLANIQGRREEWQGALHRLMAQLCDWMKEAVAQHLLQVEQESHVLREEQLGPPYSVPTLKVLTPAGVTLRIIPRARYVVGAMGRVDLECTPKKAILVRKDESHWQLAELTPGRGGWSFKDLTEESFWEALSELLS